jgi:hypothetical protein
VRSRDRATPVIVALAVIAGLLWSGAIEAEMKWTATIFGLALAAFLFTRS